MGTHVALTRHDRISVITIDNPPVNALSSGVCAALRIQVAEAGDDNSCDAIVVIGAGRTFPAGADIKDLEDVALGRTPKGPPPIHDLLADIENSSTPVVMALHGTALGGGLELAMAGHYRVATPDARLGLPEVTLGIIPGAEGSQRLPRLVGIRQALDMCVSGRPVSAKDAVDHGLIDSIVTGNLLDGAVAFAEEKVCEGGPHPRTRELVDRLGTPVANAPLYAAARAQAGRLWRGMSAPLRVIESIEAAATLSFSEGCRHESEIVAECLNSDECRALIHAFFAERQVRRVRDLPTDTPVLDVRNVAVVGAGIMGSGIATILLNADIDVILTDTEWDRVEAGMRSIRQNFQRSVDRHRMKAHLMEERLNRIHPQIGYAGFDKVDLVIEAVFEDMALKKSVFGDLDRETAPGTILASNTSTLDIDEIASVTSRPENVIGLHFFNPAHVMRLLEVVRGSRTGNSTLSTALELGKKLGKTGVVVGNCRGFVGNRMMLPYMREAQFLIEEGALPQDVDRALYDFGMAMGIFAVDDMGGLDLQWRVRQEEARLGLAGDRPLRVLPRLCELGRLGQKTGRGWYRYEQGDRRPIPDPELGSIVESVSRAAGITRRAVSSEEIVQRCIYVMVNEGARILEEGHVQRASDIDVIYFTGYGFPRWRGGPMWYADTVGLGHILQRIRDFRQDHGAVWEPAPLIERLVSQRQRFRDLDLNTTR